MLTETWIVNPKIVNETRFQYSRNYTDQIGNLLPQINVSGAFIAGGANMGTNYDTRQHFELQNNTSILHGAHTFRYGVRARRESDRTLSPNGFGGSLLLRWRIGARAGCQQQHRDRRRRQSGDDHAHRGGPVYAHPVPCRRPASLPPRSANWAAARRSSISMPAIRIRASSSTISASSRRTTGACAPTSP